MSMITAIYPGSFDPITLGHLNVIRRTSAIFDKLVVCVMVNSNKNPLFTTAERVSLIERTVARFHNVEVKSYDGLLVEFMKDRDIKVIIKGLRAVSDYDKELQIALVNRHLDATIETMFMPSSEKYTHISSSVVKEMARYGADLSAFVPVEIIGDVVSRIKSER